LFKKEGNVIRP